MKVGIITPLQNDPKQRPTWAHMGPFGPIWAHLGIWVIVGEVYCPMWSHIIKSSHLFPRTSTYCQILLGKCGVNVCVCVCVRVLPHITKRDHMASYHISLHIITYSHLLLHLIGGSGTLIWARCLQVFSYWLPVCVCLWCVRAYVYTHVC